MSHIPLTARDIRMAVLEDIAAAFAAEKTRAQAKRERPDYLRALARLTLAEELR